LQSSEHSNQSAHPSSRHQHKPVTVTVQKALSLRADEFSIV